MSRRHGLIGASKPYLYKEEDAEFYYRQTSGGVIMNNSPLVGSIDRIKGQTIAWNQLAPSLSSGMEQYLYPTSLSENIKDINYSNNIVQYKTSRYYGPAIRCNCTHKLYLKVDYKADDSIILGTGFTDRRVSAVYIDLLSHNIIANEWITIKRLLSGGNSDCKAVVLARRTDIDTVMYMKNIQLFDLTLIYGEGNEPSTPAQFEADYFRWFGKPLTYEPYDEGSLRNVQMEGIKTTFTNASPQTRNFDVTTLTGKLNGEGESVVIFPDGMKGIKGVKDEIYIEDGVTKAVKRIGRVDLGSLTWTKQTGATENDVYFIASKPTGAKASSNIVILCSNYNVKTWAEVYRNVSGSYNSNGIGTYNGMPAINDSSYTDATIFKTAMQGVYLDYELAEPQVYVLDTPLPIAYNCEAGGTEQILPEEIGTGIAPIMDIKYKAGSVAEKPWYGIKWSEDSGQMQRIASNMELHATLPIQSKMKRCVLLDNGSVYKYISDADPFLYEDGTSVKYDGTDGQVMVEVPAYWYTAYKETDENNITWNYLKLYPEGGGQRYSRKIYRGAFEMITDNSDNTVAKGCSVSMLDFASMGTTKDTTSFVASDMQYLSAATSYRNWNYANVDATDVKNSLGKPTTSRNRATFRGIAARRGAGFSQEYWDSYNSLIRLYVVEYCNFDIQVNINDSLTVEGFRQGGLGNGVTNANSTKWNSFNGYNPFVPCGVTVPLGNKSGVVSYAFTNDDFDDVSITYSVPSYRGIENPFGHIWKFIDGFNRKGKVENDVTTEMIYVCDTISKFAENDVDGYVLQSDTAPRATGSFGGVDWNAEGTFWPKLGGRTMYGDYFYSSYANNTWYTLRGGGCADLGSGAGLFCLIAASGSGNASAAFGSRLLYTK